MLLFVGPKLLLLISNNLSSSPLVYTGYQWSVVVSADQWMSPIVSVGLYLYLVISIFFCGALQWSWIEEVI